MLVREDQKIKSKGGDRCIILGGRMVKNSNQKGLSSEIKEGRK
jgi:hypothetical protein